MTIVEAARGSPVVSIRTATSMWPPPSIRWVGCSARRAFLTDSAGYKALLGWLETFGVVTKIGVEGTGSYGSGLARYLKRVGVEVIEVDRPDRQKRRRAASPIPSTPSKPPGPRSVVGRGASPSRATVPSRPSGSSSSPSARPARPGSRRLSRCATSATARLSSCVAALRVSRCRH